MTIPFNWQMKRKVERKKKRLLKKAKNSLYLLSALKRTNKELEIAERERLMFKNERNMSYQDNERLLKREKQLEKELQLQEEKYVRLQVEVEDLKMEVEEKWRLPRVRPHDSMIAHRCDTDRLTNTFLQ